MNVLEGDKSVAVDFTSVISGRDKFAQACRELLKKRINGKFTQEQLKTEIQKLERETIIDKTVWREYEQLCKEEEFIKKKIMPQLEALEAKKYAGSKTKEETNDITRQQAAISLELVNKRREIEKCKVETNEIIRRNL